MAEEQNGEEQEAPSGGSPLIKTIVMVGVCVLVPAILALVVVKFVVLPKMAADEVVEEAPEETTDMFPATLSIVDFEDDQVTVKTDDPQEAAPLLMYKAAMVCQNEPTSALITEKKLIFTSMLGKLHRNRTRSELNDPLIQDSILRQARQEANQLLKKFATDSEEKLQVIEVLHVKFTVVDL